MVVVYSIVKWGIVSHCLTGDYMYKYYEVSGLLNGEVEIFFSSFDKEECRDELNAEKGYWREQGYRNIKVTWYISKESPDMTVYLPSQLTKA